MVTHTHHSALLVINNPNQRRESNTKSICGHSYMPWNATRYFKVNCRFGSHDSRAINTALHIGRPPTPGPGVLRLLAKCRNLHLKLFRSRVQIWSLRLGVKNCWVLRHTLLKCAPLLICNITKVLLREILKFIWHDVVTFKNITFKNIVSSSTNSFYVRGTVGSLCFDKSARFVQLELQKCFIRWSDMQLKSHEG